MEVDSGDVDMVHWDADSNPPGDRKAGIRGGVYVEPVKLLAAEEDGNSKVRIRLRLPPPPVEQGI